MNERPTDGPRTPPQPAAGPRLDSWKKIAAHFRRDVTTVQRWERREGMPVHRHLHDKQGSVYAFSAELDAWWETRRGRLPEAGDGAPESAADAVGAGALAEPPGARRAAAWTNRRWLSVAAAAVVVLALGYAAFRFIAPAEPPWRNPLANAHFIRLTDWPGVEQAAEISRDGRWAAFLADRGGHTDAWLTQIGSGEYRNLTGGAFSGLVNPFLRVLGFSADGSFVTLWIRSADGSRPEDIKLMSAPVAGGELRDFLSGVGEAAWSQDGRRIIYHTTAPGDPLFVQDVGGTARQIYIAPAGVHCHFPIWSSDDSYIYFARGTPPNRWDLWRIRATGTGLERITFHDARVSHPVLLDAHTLLYLAGDAQGAGPWLYALDLEQRVSHRVSFGLERYASLAASAGGARLLATVAEPSSSIWSTALEAVSPGAVAPGALVSSTGFSPRVGPDYLLYVATRAGRQGIWKAQQGQSRELWGDAHATIVGAPAIAVDGRRIAFTVAEGEQTTLYTMDSDGGSVKALGPALALRGNPAWAPDGRSIVSAVLRDGEPRLASIFLDGSPVRALVSEYSIDPVWSPDGRFLLYSGADVGTTFPLRAVAADGRPYAIPPLILTRGARRVVFSPDARSIVVLRGDVGHKNFWRVDLGSGAQRQLTELAPEVVIRDFDLSRDGGAVLYDRVEESSRIALIERGS